MILTVNLIFAQTYNTASNSSSSSGWSRNDIFRNKVFIENKGQFDKMDNLSSSVISYAIIDAGQQIFFNPKGLTYRYDTREYPKGLLAEIEKEQKEGKEEKPGEFERELEEKAISRSYFVNLEWLNANSDVKIVAEDIVPQYYTYGDDKKFYKASAYKKLTYKNLYPGIDAEYVFHETVGIKYSLLLHPGADPSKIKMKYTGAENVFADKSGNVHLVTPLGDIIDHTPFTFYGSNKSEIASAFTVNNNIVSFKLTIPGPIQSNVIIDPWSVGVIMPVTNKALEVEKDGAGNVYISGGAGLSGVLIVQKFSPAGSLLWTYTPVPNGCSSFRGYYGDDLKVDPQGNIYFNGGSSACSPNGNKTIVKLSADGNVIMVDDIPEIEPYRLLIDCGAKTLFCTGSWAPRINIINPVTGIVSNILNNIHTSSSGTSSDDMRDVIRAPDGNYYGVSTVQGTNNATIRVFNPAWTNLFNVPAGFNVIYWSASYTGHNAGTPASLHLIAASKQFIFATDGAILQKRSLSTGALITSVVIPGGIPVTSTNGNSGIITDTCGNVYVGSQNSVLKYDANLAFVSSAATSAAVYDVCLGNTGEILACGNGFLASLNLSACTFGPLDVTAVVTPTGNCSNGNIGTAIATTTGGNPSYNYYWIPGGQTTSTLSGLGAGSYSVIVTDEDCNKDTAVVTVTTSGALAVSLTQTNLQCNGANNGSATVTVTSGAAPYTYLWSTGSTSATATGLSANTYTVTVTDNNGCKSILTVNISQPPALTMIAAATNTTCNNANGNATVNVVGSTGPYTYLWSNGRTGNIAGVGYYGDLAAGTYTVTVTDSKGCTQTTTATVPSSVSTVNPNFTQSPGPTVCIGTVVNFTNTGTPPGAGITQSWVISPITPTNVSGTTTDFSYTFLTAGTYTVNHNVGDGTCYNSKTSTVTVVNCAGPTVTATGSSVCPGLCAAVTSSGTGGASPYTYSWNTGETTQNINPCPSSTTTYTVTIRDTGGNTSTSTAVVTVNPAISVNTTVTSTTCSGTSTGSATAAPGGGTSPYVYVWSNLVSGSQVSGLASGTYTVTVTDSKGCTSTATATIVSPQPLSGKFIKGTASCAGCSCEQWIMVNAAGGTSPYSYTWPDGNVNRYKNQLCPGNYSVNIKDKNGCSVNVNLTAP